jgi:polyhydroxyalkanoate synthesis regulator phasin
MTHHDIPRGNTTTASTTGNKKSIKRLRERVRELEERVEELEAEVNDE